MRGKLVGPVFLKVRVRRPDGSVFSLVLRPGWTYTRPRTVLGIEGVSFLSGAEMESADLHLVHTACILWTQEVREDALYGQLYPAGPRIQGQGASR